MGERFGGVFGRFDTGSWLGQPIIKASEVRMVRVAACEYKGLLITGAVILLIGSGGAASHAKAAILTDSSERSVRQVVDREDPAARMTTPQLPGILSYSASDNRWSGHENKYSLESKQDHNDSMQALIEQKQQAFAQSDRAQVTIDEQSVIRRVEARSNTDGSYSVGIKATDQDFNRWLNASPYRANQVARYRRYLSRHMGAINVPPMDQLLTSARSWAACGYEPYQLPPQYLWHNMPPTLQLFATLKQQGVLPSNTVIRSVYRSPRLNECAGGSSGSKHMTNGAIDIWVPAIHGDPWQIEQLQDRLCRFWQYQGQKYSFGLGLYPTGSIHIDTKGHRKWGGNHTNDSSPCRL